VETSPSFQAGLGFLINGEIVMLKFVKTFVSDESGASAAEYALILAIIGTGIAGAAFLLGGAIETSIINATDCIPVVAGTAPPAGC
jgi:pilus assembly protein Flp/PilA